MKISSRQFKQLTEIGITLWQSRHAESIMTNDQAKATTTNNCNEIHQTIDLANLAKKQCFNDILIAMDLSPGEIKVEKHHLNLGLFNWSFRANKSDDITFINNQLCSPEIDIIAKSPVLKMQLWHAISTKIL